MVAHRILIGFREDDLKAIDDAMEFHGISNRTETVRFCVRKEARRIELDLKKKKARERKMKVLPRKKVS